MNIFYYFGVLTISLSSPDKPKEDFTFYAIQVADLYMAR